MLLFPLGDGCSFLLKKISYAYHSLIHHQKQTTELQGETNLFERYYIIYLMKKFKETLYFTKILLHMVVGLEITISLNVHIVYFESCYKEKYDYDRFPLTDIYANINFKLTTFQPYSFSLISISFNDGPNLKFRYFIMSSFSSNKKAFPSIS